MLALPVAGDPALLKGTDSVLFLHSGLGSNPPGLPLHSPAWTHWCSWNTSNSLWMGGSGCSGLWLVQGTQVGVEGSDGPWSNGKISTAFG